jgi:hypothetical protein
MVRCTMPICSATTMNRFVPFAAALLVGLGYLGHVHPIRVEPNMAMVKLEQSVPVQRKVGYFIPTAALEQMVITSAGGGEKVCYYPYRDLETGLYEVLSTVFIGASKVRDPKDTAALKKAGITWVVTPEITTASSSDSALVWPPNEFTIQIKLVITDMDGQVVDTLHVDGRGRAEMLEFNRNHALSATRAANDVLLELHEALRFSKVVVPLKPSGNVAAPAASMI